MVHQAQRKGACLFRLHPSKLTMMMMQETKNFQQHIAGPKEAKKSTNDLWNDIHCDLVMELKKKGTISRYNVRHLKLWTDHTMGQKSAGVGDEPKWEEFIDFVGVPPKQRKEKAAASTSSPENSSDQLLRALIIQNQQSTQLLQTSLLAILANQQSTMMQQQAQYNPPIFCSFWIPITFLTTTEKHYMHPKTHHCSKRNGGALLLLHFIVFH